jgi:hypothetical protein
VCQASGHARAHRGQRGVDTRMVGRISIHALLIMVWVAAMWAIGPERIIGFKHSSAVMALATSGVMLAAAIGVNSAWNRRFGYAIGPGSFS